ncbi:Protein of unknown function [Spirosomataceae bacterium TFI 002]|nr:Protein of unknown function [Spirosomataceae bacterium TFI 002]
MISETLLAASNHLLLESNSIWILQFLGRLHPLFVHFPVSLLVIAGFLKLFQRKINNGEQIINFLIIVGTSSAILSVGLGLILAWQDEYSGELLDFHRYSGIFLAVVSLVLLYLTINKQGLDSAKNLLLGIATIGTIVTGHWGAMLTHGDTYLTEVFPWNKSEDTSSLALTTPDTDQVKLASQVRTIFAHNCYKCHGEAKQKGDLRLDEKEFIFAGGKNGKIIIPGNAKQSEIYRRITLPVDHKESMPSKGKSLSKSEIEIIEYWIANGAFWPDDFGKESLFPRAELAPRNPSLPKGSFENPIDLWVNDYFTKNEITWKKKVDDKTYLRRVYLDIHGLTPSFQEIKDFENDSNPDKRKRIVDKLLSQNDPYAQHWLSFWNDALRNDYTGTGYITKGRFNINHWLYTSLQKNKPYNQFVKELLNPNEESKGFIEGIKWRGTVNASQRTEMQAAQNVGQVLLGLNLKCASCHDSFVSDWKLEDAYAFANIFAEERLEIARCEKPIGKFADTRLLWPSLGNIDSTGTKSEKLSQLAEALVQPSNGRMYRTIVNRVWAQVMGRGIVGTVDEMDNKPWSQDLLDWLAVNFVENDYDLKKLLFLITTSDTYQMESVNSSEPALVLKDSYQFNGMLRRRLSAEQLSDVVSKVIFPIFNASDYSYDPIALAGYQPTGSYITRASLVSNNSFLTALGRPNREIVTTSRPTESSLLQALEFTNGARLDSTLKIGAQKWKTIQPNTEQLIKTLYQEALGRNPSPQEVKIALSTLGKNPSESQIQDLFWAVIMLPEFQIIY